MGLRPRGGHPLNIPVATQSLNRHNLKPSRLAFPINIHIFLYQMVKTDASWHVQCSFLGH